MTREEMRFLRRELINYHLQNSRHNVASNPFRLHDMKFLTRNSEVYRYGQELKAYA